MITQRREAVAPRPTAPSRRGRARRARARPPLLPAPPEASSPTLLTTRVGRRRRRSGAPSSRTCGAPLRSPRAAAAAAATWPGWRAASGGSSLRRTRRKSQVSAAVSASHASSAWRADAGSRFGELGREDVLELGAPELPGRLGGRGDRRREGLLERGGLGDGGDRLEHPAPAARRTPRAGSRTDRCRAARG